MPHLATLPSGDQTTLTRSETRAATCEGCGARIEIPRFQGRFAFLNDLIPYCDDCAAEKTAALEREQLREDCRRRYFDAAARGLLTNQFRRASFATSSKEIEALNPDAWKQGREWRRKENIWISGPMGCGKTFLALCMLRKAFVAGYEAAEVTALQYAKDSETFRPTLSPMIKPVDVLLLDDIDKCEWRGDRLDALWELLNYRMSAGLRTIVTSNMTPRNFLLDLRQRASRGATVNTSRADAALDRIKPVIQIEMEGKSLR